MFVHLAVSHSQKTQHFPPYSLTQTTVCALARPDKWHKFDQGEKYTHTLRDAYIFICVSICFRKTKILSKCYYTKKRERETYKTKT